MRCPALQKVVSTRHPNFVPEKGSLGRTLGNIGILSHRTRSTNMRLRPILMNPKYEGYIGLRLCNNKKFSSMVSANSKKYIVIIYIYRLHGPTNQARSSWWSGPMKGRNVTNSPSHCFRGEKLNRKIRHGNRRVESLLFGELQSWWSPSLIQPENMLLKVVLCV